MKKKQSYVIGQRWFNHADAKLGLGIISAIEGRTLTVNFPSIEERRIYALDEAPLCRIMYRPGEKLTTNDVTLTVTKVQDEEGLLLYSGVDSQGHDHHISESKLNAAIHFNTPLERLLVGLVDKHRNYNLKIQTLYLSARLHLSKAQGLIGARSLPIAHQVHIASEVAKRFAPRVLLADEVGLGKTIEAGLILHHQLITERARRVLIIVPQTLIHQWYVEMLRRFNLSFAIFNNERYQSISDENPFETEQLIITSLDFLMSDSTAAKMAQIAHWDLVIVDEAHHLHWSADNPSPEYLCIEQFSLLCQGLLLLTATPEQLGIESHFARLRLLDRTRFHSLEQFKKEEDNFEKVSQLAKALVQYRQEEKTDLLPKLLKEKLEKNLSISTNSSISETLSMLLDRHGTGRVLFRNTRATISGFKARRLSHYPLKNPSIYQSLVVEEESQALYPETYVSEHTWLKGDPRVVWLVDKLRQLQPNKSLIITANARTAVSLEKHLRLNTSLRAAAFHEGLSIIERDRAAAYFSDSEKGADCLICSEIGSEGRNFQFSHHLILFDLPLNPDLLEQRIGRLDRIGQKHEIDIHLPYIENTPMESLFRWYHEGLNLFIKSCSFGFSMHEKFEKELLFFLQSKSIDKAQFNEFINKTKAYAHLMQEKTEAGRDYLLELNSCNAEHAADIIKAIEAEEDPDELKEYMNKVFNAYGVSHEYHSEHTEVLKPAEHMKSSYFPGLKEEGNTVTYSRHTALMREDIEFLSFEHPMVRDAMDMILNEEEGTAVLCTMSLKGLAQGTLLLETFYTPRCIAPEALNLNRYLPLAPIRVLTSMEGKNIEGIISHEQLIGLCKTVKRHHSYPIINQIKPHLENMAHYAMQHAQQCLPLIKERALKRLNQELGLELSRTVALKKVNPIIREEELSFINTQITTIERAINNATLKLEALRVVINK